MTVDRGVGGEIGGITGLAPASLRVSKENTADRAAAVHRGLIVRGEIEPGQLLREVELAPALGISRNTIREEQLAVGPGDGRGMLESDRTDVGSGRQDKRRQTVAGIEEERIG